MEDVRDTVACEGILIAHAPTGIGKTVAVLVPSLQYALEHGNKVFFLTSKRSQHKIAIDTLRLIKKHARVNFSAVDITSKQSMCPRATPLHREYYSLFTEFCKSEQKTKRCRYFLGYDSETLQRLKQELLHVEELCRWCTVRGLCPYKVAFELATAADVIVCDYNYLFAPDIAELVLEKLETGLDDLIVIVDEAHNLPDRIRNNLSDELRMRTVTSAARGIRYFDRELEANLIELEQIFAKLVRKASEAKTGEITVERDFLLGEIERILKRRIEAMSYDEFVEALHRIAGELETPEESRTPVDGADPFSAEERRVLQHLKRNRGRSREHELLQRDIIGIAEFLDGWRTREHCVRIFSLAQPENPTLYFKLLDPSVISEPIFQQAHSSILMSGTLSPTRMYADILGVTSDRIRGKEILLREYQSPFPKENRLILVTKDLTTRYTRRGEEMYRSIAEKIGEVARSVRGGMAVFFPSYELLNSIAAYLPEEVRRRMIVERRELGKEEKNRLYELLRDDRASILLAVQAGSFSEGLDYESNTLKAIIVVGLPLSPPTLEVKLIQAYYAAHYGREKGKLYGYLYPAMTKVLQAAGRGIRSERDRCIIILMDYRFAHPPYRTCLPADYELTVTDRVDRYCRDFMQH